VLPLHWRISAKKKKTKTNKQTKMSDLKIQRKQRIVAPIALLVP